MEKRHKRMVENLKREGRIKSKKVEKAFLKVSREKFVPSSVKESAYVDTPLQIGQGQTISAPHMIAIMVEELKLREGQKVLEIGAGSGYHAAIVSKIVGKKGHVYTVERFRALINKAENNLKKSGIKNVEVFEGDGSEGLEKYAPYDRIYVTCASPDIPEPLKNQLGKNGILLVPVGRHFCRLTRLTKTNDGFKSEDLGGCAFVPMIGKYGF
ncbi:MAG: protein-L-isoaspartate O-methyltransferase [Candidatus Thermoplasmatota archaeon]